MPPSTASILPPIPAGRQAIRHAVLSDGTLVVVATDVDLASEWGRIRAGNGRRGGMDRLAESGRARLLTLEAEGWRDGPVVRLETLHPLVDRFADGRWLVVGARTRDEPNARILAPDGTLLSRFKLSDGIGHVAVDGADRIWVGWFDEGVFGNDGWQVPGSEWPPSSNGLACFADDGRLIEAPSMPGGVEAIADCYALNAVGEGAWVCPYTDFALLHLVPGRPARWWRGAPAGTSAVAVDGNHLLLGGGYGGNAALATLAMLGGTGMGEGARPLATWQLPMRRALPGAADWAPVWEPAALLAGRGDTLHLVDDGTWHRWRVTDVLTFLEPG